MFKLNETNQIVTIFGTGNYGLALGSCLLKNGFKIIYGSRNPNENYVKEVLKATDEEIRVLTLSDAWKESNEMVIFAIKPENYEEVIRECCKNIQVYEKIVIDVSNSFKSNDQSSNAERLQFLLKRLMNESSKVSVVKAFNKISAYSMCQEFSNKSNELVPIASDNQKACQKVINLCFKIGLYGFMIGPLKKSRELEKSNSLTFNEWKYPTLFVLLFFIINCFWFFFHSYLTNPRFIDFNDYLNKFSFMSLLNRVTGFTSLHLLALVYLPGCLASFYQLYYGTKYKRFPLYLDLWLKSRKHLGLWSFFIASLHTMISLVILNPAYYSPWFKQNNINIHVRYTVHGELNILSGIFAFFLMCPLVVTSIKSINKSLNWSEWNFIQTKIGYSCLIASLIHVFIMFFRFVLERKLHNYSTNFILSRIKFASLWLPLTVIVLRLVAQTPIVHRRIRRIRSGSFDRMRLQAKDEHRV
jgi:predicted dinucleotide-binding enzyme/DMSO/TMAO reductase YedYZ heme-binding membrane subunit